MNITIRTPDGQEVPARRKYVKRGKISAIADRARDLVPLLEGYYMDQQRTAVYAWQEAQQPGQDDPASAAAASERKPGSYVEVPMPGGAPVVEAPYYVKPDRGQRASERMIYRVRLVKRPEMGIQEVTEADLNNGDAWAKWGGIPITRPRDRHLWADLVKAQIGAFGVQRAEAVDRTGWHQDPASGHWYYLLPDGRALQDPDHPIAAVPPLVDYRMPPQLARAWARLMPDLPDQPPTEEEVICLLGSYHEIAPHGHLFITTGAAFRSLVCSFVPAATTLVGEGAQESGKTLTQKHSRAVIGPSPYQTEADANFSATASKMEGGIAPLADLPALADNFRVQPDATPLDVRQLKEAIDRLVLSAYSGEEIRGRARRDGSPQPGRAVHTLPFLNGERIPGTILQSTLRRIMLLVYEKDPTTQQATDIDIPALQLQLSSMNATLTRWGHTLLRRLVRAANTDAAGLADRIAAREEAYCDLLLERARAACDHQEIGLYYSVARGWARVLTGWWLAEWALGLTRDDNGNGPYTAEALPHVVQHMIAQLLRMAGVQRGEDGLTRFARLALRLAERIRDHELIGGQTWQLLDLEAANRDQRDWPHLDGIPQHTWGWHTLEQERTPVCAGYVSVPHGAVYLLPKAIEYLRKLATQEHQDEYSSLRTDQGLWDAAWAEGWIVRRGEGRNRGVKIGRQGKLGRAWALSLPHWLGSDPSQPQDEQPAQQQQQPEEEEGRQTP